MRVVAYSPFALGLLLLAAACSSGAHPEDRTEPRPIPECEAYATTYGRCFRGSGTEVELTRRVSALREGFTAAKDEASRTAARDRCIAGDRRLQEACR